MAYRFNPPPNWPIDDANWSPPPGWQPDPSWGPAPDGWNFWVADDQAPAAPAATDAAPAADQAPAADAPPAAEDDATRLASTGAQAPAAATDDDPTHLASTGEQAPGDEQTPSGEQAPSDTDSSAVPEHSAPAAAGQYGTVNPYGPAAPRAGDASGEETHGRHAAGPAPVGEDDATHVADSGQRAAAEEPGQGDAPLAPEADAPDEAAQAEDVPAADAGSSETAEYEGPDLEAGLAQQAPYETAEPTTADGYGEQQDQYGQQDQYNQQDQYGQQGTDSGAGVGTAAVAGAAAAGGVAAGGAAAQHGAGAEQGAGQAPEAPGYGQGDQGQGYGQASPAPGYGQGSPSQGYGQGSPSQGYGQASPAPGYGQGSPSQGYGQGSPSQGYGQGSASDYPAQGYDQGSPGVDTGSGWTASTGAGEPPKKSVIQRFWWVGCLAILFLALVLIVAGGIWMFSRGGDEEAGEGDPTSTSEEATTEEGDPTDEQTTEEEPTEEEPTDEETEETPLPTDLPTIDPAAEEDAINIVGMDGTGTIAVDMTYAPAKELESRYGGTVDEPEHGKEYLVVTAKLTVTEGEMGLNPASFDVITPYGGEVGPSSATYGLKGSGTDGPTDFTEGDEYTIKILFDVKRAKDLTLNFTTYSDDYTWDVPA